MKELAELNTVKKDVDARLSLMIDEKKSMKQFNK